MSVITDSGSVIAVSFLETLMNSWRIMLFGAPKPQDLTPFPIQTQQEPEEFCDLCHSLRTPLNAIIGFSQMMSSQVYGPLGHDKYQDYSCAISQSGEDLLQQIEILLNQRTKDHVIDASMPILIEPRAGAHAAHSVHI